jgi:hypothetical protein
MNIYNWTKIQANDDFSLPLFRTGDPESLRFQLEAFQTHLNEIESVIPSLSKFCPEEVESFLLIRKLVNVKIEQLKHQIKMLEEDSHEFPFQKRNTPVQ